MGETATEGAGPCGTGGKGEGTPSRGEVFGGYRIVRPLGLGGAGDVFLAENVLTGARSALKVMSAEATTRREAREEFARRVGALQALGGHGIAAVHHAAEEGGRLFYTMDCVDGPDGDPRTLAQELGDAGNPPGGGKPPAGGKLPEDRVRRITIDICAGLGAAHEAGVPHGDLRPEKVLLDRDGGAWLTGFAVVNLGDVVRAEAAEGSEHPDGGGDPRSDTQHDIHALGLVVYRMLTGKSVGFWNVPPSAAGCEEIWDRVLEKALAPERGDRYSSVAELARELGAEPTGPERPPGRSTSDLSRPREAGDGEAQSEPDTEEPGEWTVELTFPAEACFVALARSAVACAGRDLEVDEACAKELDRVVDELMGLYCGRASESKEGPEDPRIRIRADLDKDDGESFGLEFRVWDGELALRPGDRKGLAFRTIRLMCDEVEVEDLGHGGQVVRARKNLD